MESWVKLPADVIASPALRHLPRRALLVVLAVLDEHLRHAGKDNGNLTVSYRTLAIWLGTSSRNAIALAIREAAALKVIRAKGRRGAPTRYGVTWLEWHDGAPAPDDWRAITTGEQARAILAMLQPHRKSDRYRSAARAGRLGLPWGNGRAVR